METKEEREKVSFSARIVCQQEEPGSFTALIYSPANVVHGYQIVAAEALDRQVRQRNLRLPFLSDHENRVESILGQISRLRKTEQGVEAEGSFHLQTQRSTDVYNLFKAGMATDVSIGAFIVARREPNASEKRKGAREVLTELELFELSAVAMGADKSAKVTTLNADTEKTQDKPREDDEALTSLASALADGVEAMKMERIRNTLRTAVSDLKAKGGN